MIRILFVCHGNICRSPMAEYVMKDLVEHAGLAEAFYIASAATSTEEIGNPVHRGTRNILALKGISCEGKTARQIRRDDYDAFDFLIGMDNENIRKMNSLFGGDPQGKISKLFEFAGSSGNIADPWYTGDFETTYRDVLEGCEALLEKLEGSL